MPVRHHLSTGTANRRPPHAPFVCANGYHRRPYPATQTTGSAQKPRTASPMAPTAGTKTCGTACSPQPQPQPSFHQPPHLLRATHRHPPGLPWRALRGGPSGRCVDQSHGHRRITPAPPQPAPTPRQGQLERGGPLDPFRPLPPPPWPPSPGPTAPRPLRSDPGAGSVGRDANRGGSRLPPAHLLPVQHHFWSA